MLKQKHQVLNHLKKSHQQGFTIVELLIVIIVIAILAALVIAAYNGIQQMARDNERQTDMRTLAQEWTMYNQKNNGALPNCNGFIHSDAASAFVASIMKIDTKLLQSPGQTSMTFVDGNATDTTKYGCQQAVLSQSPITISWREEADNGATLKTRTISW